MIYFQIVIFSLMRLSFQIQLNFFRKEPLMQKFIFFYKRFSSQSEKPCIFEKSYIENLVRNKIECFRMSLYNTTYLVKNPQFAHIQHYSRLAINPACISVPIIPSKLLGPASSLSIRRLKYLWGNNWDWTMYLLYVQPALMLDVNLQNWRPWNLPWIVNHIFFPTRVLF